MKPEQYFNDFKDAIEKAKKNNLLTEKVKVFLAGQIMFCQYNNLLDWKKGEELLKLVEIERKYIIGVSEIASYGELTDCSATPIEFQKGE